MAKKVLTQDTTNYDNVSALPDIVKNQATSLKTTFDKAGNDQKTFMNGTLLTELQDSTLEGDSGSFGIGHNSANLTSDNVGDGMEELKGQIDGLVVGMVPPGTPGYYLRTNDAGTDVEWSDIDLTMVNNNSKAIAQNSAVIDELVVAEGISTKIAPTSGKFYDFVGASGVLSQGEIDLTKAYADTVTQGTNTVSVTSMNVGVITDFVAGMEVTLQDDTSKEVLTIQSVADPVITFTGNIVNTYASGANVYRSNLKDETDDWSFGGFSSQEIIDKTTPEQVVASAYTTQGNGGRKVVYLDNGWLFTSLRDGTTGLFNYYSTDNGTTWALHSSQVLGVNYEDISIVEYANNQVQLICALSTNQINSYKIDVPNTIGDTNFGANTILDISQTAMGNCSLAINSDGTKITATWSSKNATYPNSFNIRAIQGTISAGVVTWGSVEQVTQNNNSSFNITTPSINYDTNDNVHILVEYDFTSGINILDLTDAFTSRDQLGSEMPAGWGNKIVFSGGTYTQSNPSATFMPPSIATKINASYTSGLIICPWQGKDSTYTTVFQIKIKASSDNGATWFDFGISNEQLTQDASNELSRPSISWNDDGDIFVTFMGRVGTASAGISLIENNVSTGWGSFEVIDSDNTTSRPNSADNYHNFEKPLTIYQSTTDVQFYGKWTVGSEIDLTDIDIRMNITPLEDVSDIGAYMNISNNVNTVDGKVSIVDSASNESYTDLIDTRYAIDSNDDEVASLLNTSVTAEDKVTLKYTMNRSLTTDDVRLNSIIGGVA